MSLQGKRVVVLGASSGIGLATAQAAAREGASLVVVSSQEARLKEALKTLPANTEGHNFDLAHEESQKAFFEKIGDFDHLAFTAGDTLVVGPFDQVELAKAKRYWELRYWGSYYAAKYGHKHIRKGGSITFTGGAFVGKAAEHWATPIAVVHALKGLTESLALELKPLRVNVVAAGMMKSPLWTEMLGDAVDGVFEAATAGFPLGRAGTAEEMAKGFVYLMNQTYSTGLCLLIDGGMQV